MKKRSYSVPSMIEPRIESWLERQNVSFEVAVTNHPNILKVIPDWGDLPQKEIIKINDRIESLIRKEKEKLVRKENTK